MPQGRGGTRIYYDNWALRCIQIKVHMCFWTPTLYPHTKKQRPGVKHTSLSLQDIVYLPSYRGSSFDRPDSMFANEDIRTQNFTMSLKFHSDYASVLRKKHDTPFTLFLHESVLRRFFTSFPLHVVYEGCFYRHFVREIRFCRFLLCFVM